MTCPEMVVMVLASKSFLYGSSLPGPRVHRVVVPGESRLVPRAYPVMIEDAPPPTADPQVGHLRPVKRRGVFQLGFGLIEEEGAFEGQRGQGGPGDGEAPSSETPETPRSPGSRTG